MVHMALPSRDEILQSLTAVIDPELRENIVELGMVRSIDIADDGAVAVMVSLTTAGCPIRNHFQTAVVKAVQERWRRRRRSASPSTSSPTREKGALQKKLGRAGGAARPARSPRSRTSSASAPARAASASRR